MFRVGFGSSSMNGGIEDVYRRCRLCLDSNYRRYFVIKSRQSFDVMYDENLMLDTSSRFALPCLALTCLRLAPASVSAKPASAREPDDDVGFGWAFKPQLHLHIILYNLTHWHQPHMEIEGIIQFQEEPSAR